MKFNDYKSVVNSSGDFMKLKKGENKVRIVSEFEPFESEFNGQMKTRFMGYVIDREDGQIKPLTVGPQIFGRLGELSMSSEYGFENLPPYDITITKTGDGMDTEYSVDAARKDTPLTEAEETLIRGLKPVTDIIEAMNKKVRKEEPVVNEDDIDDINASNAGRQKDRPF